MNEDGFSINKKRLFVDVDGTLAEFRQVDTLEKLYEKGYFLNLKPHMNVIEAVRNIKLNHPDIEVYILSAVLSDSKYALEEKNQWLDKYLPEITSEYRIFPPCGEDKKDHINGGVEESDFLLDDYSVNLNAWEPPARGIKLMNGINGNHGTWQSDKLGIDKSADELASNIVSIIKKNEHFHDIGPGYLGEGWNIENVSLSHDGYAEVKISVREYQDGAINSFITTGHFRINDPQNGGSMSLIDVSEDIFAHPVLYRQWKFIEEAIGENIHLEETIEALEIILTKATETIYEQKSPWGAWFGHVVNNDNPLEYFKIDVEGIERTSQLFVNLYFVKGNESFFVDGCSFYIDAENKENLNYIKNETMINMKKYIAEGLKDFIVTEKGLTLYSPFSDKKLDEHYQLLAEKGVSIFPEHQISNLDQQNHIRKGR